MNWDGILFILPSTMEIRYPSYTCIVMLPAPTNVGLYNSAIPKIRLTVNTKLSLPKSFHDSIKAGALLLN